MSNIIVLGIAGGSGSGKTTLMKNLIARFQDDVTVLSHDNYYRPYDELTIEERRNEKAQMNHVQTRFWEDMVEMQGGV